MIGRSNPPPVDTALKPKGFDDYELRLGDVMRGERATMGKSLLDVQRDLKIKATYIAAIENADPTGFETQGFIAGYVRSYARYLGLDPEWAYQRFCDEANFATIHGMSTAASPRSGAEKAAKAKAKKSDPLEKPNVSFTPPKEALWNRVEPGAIGSSLVLVMLLSAVGYGGWAVFQEIQKVKLTPVDQAPGVVSTIATLDSGVAALDEAEDYAGFAPNSTDALDRLYKPQVLDLPVMVARDGPIATLNPSNVGTLAPVPEPEVAGPQVAEVGEQAISPVQVVEDLPPQVELLAARPSWVRVTAADGTVLFEKILDAGERYVLPITEEPPLLRAGNAGSLYFAVNGETYGPAGQGQSVVKEVPLSVDAVSGNYAVADLERDTDLARIISVAQAEGLE